MTEPVSQAAVVFADLSGFTALTEVHGDEHAADLAEGFASLTREVLESTDRLVKTIGDAVMVTSTAPGSAVALIGRIRGACADADRFPILRVGAHFGPVVERAGDVYGSTVNLAARVAAAARGDQVLVTRTLAAAAEEAGLTVRDLGAISVRNVTQPIVIFELSFAEPDSGVAAVDPVCRMKVDPAEAAGRLHHDGVDYVFCSLSCAGSFAAAPHRFAHLP